tara:strand:- start:1950 stop:2108 length:159 start_codon:yes stop_codon:yes gene_type:complete
LAYDIGNFIMSQYSTINGIHTTSADDAYSDKDILVRPVGATKINSLPLFLKR